MPKILVPTNLATAHGAYRAARSKHRDLQRAILPVKIYRAWVFNLCPDGERASVGRLATVGRLAMQVHG